MKTADWEFRVVGETVYACLSLDKRGSKCLGDNNPTGGVLIILDNNNPSWHAGECLTGKRRANRSSSNPDVCTARLFIKNKIRQNKNTRITPFCFLSYNSGSVRCSNLFF